MLERLSGKRDGGIEEESQETKREKKNKDKEKSPTEVDI